MKKALQVASVASMIDQFNMENISILQKQGYKVDVAANFEWGSTSSKGRVEEFRDELESNDVKIYNLLFNRRIFKSDNFKVYKELKKLIDDNDYDIIHCHSPIGGVLTRLASRKARKKGTKVIYTAHGFHFFKGASIVNWLLYFPVEFICAIFTDTLITMNNEDYTRAQKLLKAKKIEYIPGIGVDTKTKDKLKIDKEDKRSEFGLSKGSIVLLSVGELIKRKNHEVVIRALAELNNSNVYYLICGQGAKLGELKQLSKELNIDKQVVFGGFRKDIPEICEMSDIFIFPSLQEGLPVSLMEAMMMEKPVICSKIRGNEDLIVDNKGGYLLDINDVKGFADKIKNLIEKPELCNEFGSFNKDRIKNFDKDKVNEKMEEIYINSERGVK